MEQVSATNLIKVKPTGVNQTLHRILTAWDVLWASAFTSFLLCLPLKVMGQVPKSEISLLTCEWLGIIVQSEFIVPSWKQFGKDHVQEKVSVSLQQAWYSTYFLNIKTKLGLGFRMCREHISPPNKRQTWQCYFFSHLKLTKREKLPRREAWWYWRVDVRVKKMKQGQHEGWIPVKVKTNCNPKQADWLVGKEVRCLWRKLGEDGTDCSL